MIIAIDPGPTQSAVVVWDGERVLFHSILSTAGLLGWLARYQPTGNERIALEKVCSYGMSVGAEVFMTCFITGVLWREASTIGPVALVPRLKVKTHICHSARATDANIRTALIDRFGPPHTFREEPRFGAKGQPIKPERVKVEGITYGLHDDLWAAFGLAVTVEDCPEIFLSHLAPPL